MKDYSLSQTDAELIADNLERTKLFEDVLAANSKVLPKNASNWVLGDVAKVVNETGKSIFETKLDATRLAELIVAIQDNKISNSAGKTVFEELMATEKSVDDIIKEKGLAQISDSSELEAVVAKVLADNQKSVDDYHNGKTNALGFLMGQCMKATKGKGNPAMMKEMIMKALQA